MASVRKATAHVGEGRKFALSGYTYSNLPETIQLKNSDAVGQKKCSLRNIQLGTSKDVPNKARCNLPNKRKTNHVSAPDSRKEKYIILNWRTELYDLVTSFFREVTKGYKNNEVIWLFVSLRLCQVQTFP